MKIKDGAFIILFKDDRKDQVFLVRRDDFYIWGTTGGGIEGEETPTQAALREAQEETGFQVKIVKQVGVYQIPGLLNSFHRLYLFEGRIVAGRFKPEFPGCLGRWFNVHKLPPNMTTHSRQKIIDAVNHINNLPFHKTISENILLDFHLLFFDPLGALKFLLKKSAKYFEGVKRS